MSKRTNKSNHHNKQMHKHLKQHFIQTTSMYLQALNPKPYCRNLFFLREWDGRGLPTIPLAYNKLI